MLSEIEKKNLEKKIKGIKSTTEKIRILLNEKLNSDFANKDKIKKDIKEKIKKKEIHKDIFYGYKVASDMWDLAGDKSTDLNYYSKRLILVSIYSNILFKKFAFLASNISSPKIFLITASFFRVVLQLSKFITALT